MGFWAWLTRGRGHGVEELGRRAGVALAELQAVPRTYRSFGIAKRLGGTRQIQAPHAELKRVQRILLRRVLGRLRAHPAAIGFERGRSIVHHAAQHSARAVVLCMDIENFFASTAQKRVRAYFRQTGWNRPAADLLTALCCHGGSLPPGAPTSPRLSNLVNFRLDARLSGLARRVGARYSRYADDLTFSFASDDSAAIHRVIRATKIIVGDYGYRIHHGRKLRIRRRHQQQRVTGLVVNAGPRVDRRTRRRLRAVVHRIRQGRQATLHPNQLAGWHAYLAMIDRQRDGGSADHL
jgi:RNA-directed DNA polymerase